MSYTQVNIQTQIHTHIQADSSIYNISLHGTYLCVTVLVARLKQIHEHTACEIELTPSTDTQRQRPAHMLTLVKFRVC